MSSPTTTQHPTSQAGETLVPVPPGWTWTITAPNGYTVTGHPPTQTSELSKRPDDHDRVWFDDGLSVPVTFGTAPALPWDILAVATHHSPNSATPPTARIQLINDQWINDLSPADLTNLATKGHALLDTLTHAAHHAADIGKWELAGIRLPITSDDQPTREQEVLASTIHYAPASSTKPPTPTISIRIVNNIQITLTPTTLTDFTTRAHAYFDMLTNVLTPTLTATDQATSPHA